jgi:hypothetical protein
MFTFKTRVQSVPEIILSGFALYSTSLKRIWIWSLLLATLNTLPCVAVAYLVQRGYGNKPLLYTGLLTFCLSPLSVFGANFILYQIYLIGAQTQKSMSDSVQWVLKKLPLLFLSLTLASLASWLGLLVFFLPGLFLSVLLVFLAPLILLDEYSVVKAYRYSGFLVWKSWWRTFSVIVIPMILTLLASPLNYHSHLSVLKVVFSVLEMTLITPLFFSLMLTLYYDAKLRHHLPLYLPRKRAVGFKATQGEV